MKNNAPGLHIVARWPKARVRVQHCATEGHYFLLLLEATSQYLF